MVHRTVLNNERQESESKPGPTELQIQTKKGLLETFGFKGYYPEADFFRNQSCAGAPRCKEAVRQLLAVINEFLLFRFKGFKCLFCCLFITICNCRTACKPVSYTH